MTTEQKQKYFADLDDIKKELNIGNTENPEQNAASKEEIKTIEATAAIQPPITASGTVTATETTDTTGHADTPEDPEQQAPGELNN